MSVVCVKALARLWSLASAFLLVVSALFAPTFAQAQAITVSPPGLASASPGVTYTQTFTATGQPGPYTFTVSAGALPPGLTLSPAGVLSGVTPLAEGPYDFTIRATAPNTSFGSRPYRLTIRTPTINLSPAGLPPVNGQPYSQTLTASGGRAPYVYTVVAGALPPGLALNANRVEGTATTPGVYGFSIRAADDDGFSTTRAYSIEVNGLAVGTQYSPSASVYAAYSGNFLAQTALPYTVSLDSGTLPPGLTLAPSGSLTGTPTAPGNYSFVIRVTDINGLTGVVPCAISVSAPNITVAPPAQTVITPGENYSQSYTANGGMAPYTFALTSGALPTGLTLAPSGLLSGTTSALGSYVLTIRATDANGFTGSSVFGLDVVTANVVLAPTTLPTARQYGAYMETVTASGGAAPYGFTLDSGALPAGLSLTSEGVISGTPTVVGDFVITLKATDANGLTGTRAYTLSVLVPVLTLTPSSLIPATAGEPYPVTLGIDGGLAPFTYAVTSGALPAGLTLTSAGQFAGAATTPGDYAFSVTGTDANGATASRPYALRVNAPTVFITTLSVPAGTGGVAFSQTLAATGGAAPYAWSLVTGSLPNGVVLSGSGVLSGTPTVAGTFPFTVRATDANGFIGDRLLSLEINAPTIAVAPGALAAVTSHEAFSQALSASGGSAPYSYAVIAGALPGGTGLSAAGVLSGTATATGNFGFTVRATDAGGFTSDKVYNLQVVSPTIVPGPATLPNGQAGVAYSTALTATGGTGPYTFAASGQMPSNMTLTGAGLLSGTPILSGTFDFVVDVTDANGFAGSRLYQVVISNAAPLALTPATLPDGAGGAAYSQAFTAAGGVGPYTFSQSGALPRGMTFNPATAVLAGTPRDTGTFTFLVQVEDAVAQRVSRSYTLQIAAVNIAVSPSVWPTVVAGTPYSLQLAASGGTAPYTFIQLPAPPNDPQGLGISSGGLISGVAVTPGDYRVYYRVTDAFGFAMDGVGALSVTAPTITVTSPAAGSLPGLIAGSPYSQTFTAAGGAGPHTFAVAGGALPAGMTLSSSGVLSGAPTVVGSFSFSVRASDSSPGPGGPFSSAPVTYTLEVSAPTITVTSPAAGSLPDVVAGSPYNQTFTASGGAGPYTFALATGTLPAGLTLSSAGVLSGTPTQAGAFSFAIRATDSGPGPGGPFSSAATAYTLTVNAPTLAIAPATLVQGRTNQAYSQTFSASGGSAPYSWAVTGGSLPAGLTLSAAGVLSGTPTTSGTFNISVQATDANGFTVSGAYIIVISPSAIVGPPVTVAILAGQTTTVDLTAGAVGGPFTGAALVGLSPANSGSAVISSPSEGRYVLTFTPAATFSGTATATYTLSNGGGVSAPGTVTVIVEARPDPTVDPEVTGLISAQGETARRFASSQVDNIGARMEGLRDGTGTPGASLQLGFSGGSRPVDYGLDPSLQRLDRSDSDLRGVLANRIAADAAPGAAGLLGAAQGGGQGSSGPLGVWAAGVVDFGRHDGQSHQEGARFTTNGLTAGIDYRIDDQAWLGLGLGYGRDVTRIGDDGSRSESSGYSAAVYGGVRPSQTSFLDAVLGYGALDYEASRYISATGALAIGERDGTQWFSAVTGGWDFNRGQWSLSPYGRLALSRSVLDAYAETTGGLYALAYAEQTLTTTTGSLGLRGARDWLTDQGLLMSQFRLEYSHDFGSADDVGLSYVDWVGGPTYQLAPRGYGHDRVRLGGGLELVRRRGMRLGLDYEIQLAKDLLQQQIGVRLQTPF